MSALTDFFTSLANAIRTNLKTTKKYTPAQAVAAIPSVYKKGVSDTKVGTAAASDVLVGKTFTNSSTVEETGTMPNYSSNSRKKVVWGSGSGNTTFAMRLDSDGKNYTIAVPKGYWNWSYAESSVYIPAETKTVTPSGSAQTVEPTDGNMLKSVSVKAVSLSGDAGVANVLEDKTFYSSSLTKKTGTMTNRGAVSKTLNPSGSYTIPSGYHNGDGKVTANANTGRYTFPTGSKGEEKDLKADNTYRYVEATNVYSQGVADGKTAHNMTLPYVGAYGDGYGNGLYHSLVEFNVSNFSSLYVDTYTSKFSADYSGLANSYIEKYVDGTWTTLITQTQNVESKTLEKTYNIATATKIRIYVATFGISSWARFNTIKFT